MPPRAPRGTPGACLRVAELDEARPRGERTRLAVVGHMVHWLADASAAGAGAVAGACAPELAGARGLAAARAARCRGGAARDAEARRSSSSTGAQVTQTAGRLQPRWLTDAWR